MADSASLIGQTISHYRIGNGWLIWGVMTSALLLGFAWLGIIFVLLLDNAEEIVTREQIQENLWPTETVVEFEHGIGGALKKLWRALSPCYIEILSRRGNRLEMSSYTSKEN